MPVINPRLFYAFALLALIAEPSVVVPEPHAATAVASEADSTVPVAVDATAGYCPLETSSPETSPAA